MWKIVYPEQREKAGKHATGEAVEGEAWSKEDKEKDIDINDKMNMIMWKANKMLNRSCYSYQVKQIKDPTYKLINMVKVLV